MDNDRDGLVDLQDPGCANSQDNNEADGTSQCQDGRDNDNDGLTDMADPGCSSPQDNNESDGTSQCQDGRDNDNDGLVDLQDPGCANPQDNNESDATSQCQDGVDNDSDGFTDRADSGCHTDGNPNNPASYNPTDNTENGNSRNECADSRDNDGDGLIDGADPQCHTDGNAGNVSSYDPSDNSEAPEPTPTPTPAVGGPPPAEGDVTIAKSDGHETAQPGKVLTYRITVRNPKTNDVTIKLVDQVPPYLVPIDTRPEARLDAQRRHITWENQTISAGAEVSFTFTARVQPDAPHNFELENVVVMDGPGVHGTASDKTKVVSARVAGAVAPAAAPSPTPAPAPSAPKPVPTAARTGLDGGAALLGLGGIFSAAGGALLRRRLL